MKRLAAVVVREWAAQRNVVLSALVLAALPWLLGLHPSIGADDRAAIVAIAAAVLAGGFLVIVSFVLGATMGSLSFYIARPLTATQLWAGNVVADASLIAAGSALIGVAAIRAWPWASLALLGVVPLLVIANYVSLVVRARGLGFLADLALLVIVGALATASTWPFAWRARAPLAGMAMGMLWLVSWLVALALAGVRAARSASFDVRLAAKVARRVLWRSTVVLGVTLDLVYASYVVVLPPLHPLPLTAHEVGGDWIAIVGFNAGRLDYYRLRFLNGRTGERIDLHAPAFSSAGSVIASGDARHFFWSAWSENETDRRLYHLDPERKRVERPAIFGQLAAVAPDGSRVAVASRWGVRIVDVASTNEIRRVDARYIDQAIFLDRDHLRILVLDHERGAWLEVRTIDIRTGAEETIRRDASSSPIKSLLMRGCLLADGRFVALMSKANGRDEELHVFARDGREERVIVVSQSETGIYSLSVAAPGFVSGSCLYGTLLFDLERGTSRVLPGIYNDGGTVYADQSHIRRFDPHTGNETTIASGESASPWMAWIRRGDIFGWGHERVMY